MSHTACTDERKPIHSFARFFFVHSFARHQRNIYIFINPFSRLNLVAAQWIMYEICSMSLNWELSTVHAYIQICLSFSNSPRFFSSFCLVCSHVHGAREASRWFYFFFSVCTKTKLFTLLSILTNIEFDRRTIQRARSRKIEHHQKHFKYAL